MCLECWLWRLYGAPAASGDDQSLVVEYVESLLFQNASVASMEDSDVLGVIGGHGGVQVDVVFYLLSPGMIISSATVILR